MIAMITDLNPSAICSSIHCSSCSYAAAGSGNHNLNKGHGFRIKTISGSTLGIRVVMNESVGSHDKDSWNADVSFYINDNLIKTFRRVGWSWRVQNTGNGYNVYDLYLYENIYSNTVTKQIINDHSGPTGNIYPKKNVYTFNNTTTVDVVFTND